MFNSCTLWKYKPPVLLRNCVTVSTDVRFRVSIKRNCRRLHGTVSTNRLESNENSVLRLCVTVIDNITFDEQTKSEEPVTYTPSSTEFLSWRRPFTLPGIKFNVLVTLKKNQFFTLTVHFVPDYFYNLCARVIKTVGQPVWNSSGITRIRRTPKIWRFNLKMQIKIAFHVRITPTKDCVLIRKTLRRILLLLLQCSSVHLNNYKCIIEEDKRENKLI